MANFDPYLQWLGIRSPERPPNHYRLLGVEPFESEANVIETAADRQMAHVRTFQNGKDADLSQQILNELAAAKLCLLDGKSKFEYDTRLKERYFNDPPPVDPATIDISPTESRVSDIEDEPEVEIAIEDDSFQLSRPKRSARGSRMRLLMGGVVGLLVLGGIAYQFGPSFLRSSDKPIAKSPDQPDPLGENREPETDPAGTGITETPESSDPDKAKGTDGTSESRDNGPSDASPDKRTPTPGERVAVVEPRTPLVDPSSEDSQDSASTVPPWARPVKRSPFKYQSDNPLESFAIAIAGRDVEASQIILDSHADAGSLGRNFATRLEALVLSHEQFWQAVSESIDELRMGTELQYRGVAVQVIGRKRDSVQLKAKNGERKSFSTKQVDCDPDLAIAFVLHRHRQNPHVAWRLIGTFVSVDKQGDIGLAQKYWADAERSGIAVAPDRRAFTFLSQVVGADVPRITADISDADPSREDDQAPEKTSLVLDTKEPRNPVPGINALRAARKRVSKDLDSFFTNKTEQGKTILAEELLSRATQDRLNPISAFAFLDMAKQVGIELKRGDLILRSLVEMARNYDLDLVKESNAELSSFETSTENKSIVETAIELGDAMIRADEFGLADDLLSIAESRLQSLPDANLAVDQYRTRLVQSKEIGRAGVVGLQTLEKDTKDQEANLAVGLHHLIRHRFQEGLTHLLLCGHAELQDLAMKDLVAAETSRPNMTLAASWEILAVEFEGVVRSSMLDRAKFWTGR